MLNFIWVSFFIIPFTIALYQGLVLGDGAIWTDLVTATFNSSRDALKICISLAGILCLWLGLLKIAEASGLTKIIAKLLRPLFKYIMPEIPDNHPAMGSIIMNMAANFLGLDNAATPIGLKAMEQLQELNPKKDTASNAQIMFMVLNSSAVTVLPITILMYRAQLGSVNPSAVFIPILLATSISTFVGFLSVAITQRLNIFNKVVLSYILGFAGLVGLIVYYFYSLPAEDRVTASTNIGNAMLFSIMISFIIAGVIKRINIYDVFISGAKEGFEVAVKIIPYLVAMLVAIALMRASGVIDFLVLGFEKIVLFFGGNADFVPALPTAFMKPLSGTGARAMMIETMQNYGVDSFPAFVSSVVQGSTETTFYVLALYFGVIKISKIRHALACSLFADFVGVSLAIYFAYMFY